jgi:uncharacterized membrane protein
MNEKLALRRQGLFARRFTLWLIILGILLLMGFYAATDPARVASDHLLNGADVAGYAVCHRITGHSFTLAGRQLPLCARCTGIYLGIMLVFSSLGLAGRWRWSDLPPRRVLLVLAGFIAIMGVDGLNSYSHFFPAAPHLYEPRNWLRLLTGLGTGLAMGIMTLPALAQSLWREQVRRAAVDSVAELAGLVALAVILALLVLSNRPGLLYVLAIVSAAGVVLILTILNTIVLLILLRRDARAVTWRQVLLPLGAGLCLALLQIGAIGVVRYALTGTMTGFPGL